MGEKPQKRNIFLLVFLVFFVIFGFFVYNPDVFAATSYTIEDIGGSIGLGTADLKTLVINIIKWVLGVLSLVAVSYLIYGGILWMTSRGNEEKITKAKKTIINAVIGVVIVLLAWAIVLFVTRFITNTGGGGGISCTPGDIHPSDSCRICNAAGDGYRPSLAEGCLDPAGTNIFRVENFSTAHEPGAVNQNLYTCSAIGTLFNRKVDGTTVTPIANTDLKLEELKCSVSGAKCFIDSDCAGGLDVCQATLVSGDWSTIAKTLKYQHKKVCSNDPTISCLTDSECGGAPNTCDLVLFAQNMNYRLSLPKTIKSLDGLFLSQTNLLFCDTSADPITCTFSTGFLNDTTPPAVTTTDPVHVGDDNYPDQNVNRTPIISVNFSESIDASTLTDSSSRPLLNNIFLQKLDGQGGAAQSGGVLDTDNDTFIDPDKLIVAEGTDSFTLRLEDTYLLEAFTWYKITVQNVADMCGNAMAAPVVWEFEANDKVPGIQGWSPKGDNQCPDVKIRAVFSTSMYYHRVQFELVDVTAGNSTIGVYTIESPEITNLAVDTTGLLRIANADFSDPARNFTVYELTPPSLLLPSHQYHVYVRTNLKMNSARDLLAKDWTFAVTTAEDCTCEPIITSLSPSQGGIGECITINGACFKGTLSHPADPDQLFFGTTPAPIESSENNYIVTTSPDINAATYPQFVDLTVRITYDETAYGSVTSDPFSEYAYINGDEAQGPCLLRVSTPGNVCYPGTPVTLTGKRFNAGSSVRVVTFNNTALNAPVPTTWADTRIISQVPTTSSTILGGLVHVRNDAGRSNGVPDDICQPLPGVPIVTQFWPTCDSACVNAVAGAKFSEEMNDLTMTAPNVKLEQCDNSDCDTFVATGFTLNLDYDVSVQTLTITPSLDLEINTWYKVTLTDGIRSAENVSIGNPNEGNNFVWKFKTKNDANHCSLASVDVIPATRTLKVGRSLNYTAYAYGSPDSCDASGQMLNAQSYNWSWQSSNPLQATVTSNDTNNPIGLTDPRQSVSALAATNNVRIQATAQGQSDYGDLTITEDPTYCATNADCSVNEFGESCPGSTCEDNRCTPVFLAPPPLNEQFNPADGSVGTWVSAKGCWFGNYVVGKSKILFFNNQEGIVPDTNICGTGTWTNNRILREVPGTAATGVITVNRADGQTAVSTTDFTVNTVVRPGICALNPNVGREGLTEVQIRGKNFGASRGSSRVAFHDDITADYAPAIWEDNNIRVIVPANSATGDVKVTVNSFDSNDWPFTVLSSACQTLCETDAQCYIVPNQGCNTDGCCSDRPTFISYPKNNATDVCLNTAIKISFSQAMDQSTLNASNILLASLTAAGPPPVWTNIPLAGKITAGSKTATISLGILLERNTQYRISLHPTNIKNSVGVSLNALGMLGTITFTTADSSGPCQINSLSIIPSNHIFTDTQTQGYAVQALDNKGNFIDKIPGVYDWTWAWSSADSSVVSITNNSVDDQVVWQQIATPLKNGNTALKVLAEEIKPEKVGFTGTKEARAAVRVIFCDEPWQFEDAANNCSANAIAEGCDKDFNFSLFYCRGKLNQTLLPDFDARSARGQSGSVLKQLLFKESDPEKKDGIGIRIYANPEGRSPMDWYKNNIENPGSPQSLTVDGYQAVRDGRTVYVGATNIDYDGPQIYNNIYLISYNDDASAETINIFNQMLSNWRFNTNIDTDSDKLLIARDLDRISDLKTIVGYLDAYRVSHQEYVGENMALDPGFEINSGIPSANWSTRGTPLEVSVAADQKHDGNKAAKISLGAGNAEYAIQDMAVELGKTYEVSAWIKTNITGTGEARLLSECRTPDNLNFNWTTCKLYKLSASITGTSDWVKKSVVVNANLADHKLRIGCIFSTGANSSGQAWCDDFQVREINSPYPPLTAGSYLINMSTSRWVKSWQANLGNDLGKTLPVDPLNNIICEGTPSDTDACWDEPTKTFTCLAGSHIYAYKTDNGMDYQLYANLEYLGLGNWITGSYLTCTSPSKCQCFNKIISGP